MKQLAVFCFAGLLAVSLSAGEGNWSTDLPAAIAQAKKEKKTVLMDFTGSDWCPPCKALNKEVFSSKEFADYAKDKLVLVELDFPKTKQQNATLKKANEALAEKYQIGGFPTVILLNGDGKELWRQVGYPPGSSKTFLDEIEKARKK
jgi:thioredoxin-related protein